MTETSEEVIYRDPLSILSHLWLNHQQKLVDDHLSFKFENGKGHIEFYQYGPDHIAVCIYDAVTLRRKDLLVIEVPSSLSTIDVAVREVRNMIKRKQIGNVTRRIKFLDNSD